MFHEATQNKHSCGSKVNTCLFAKRFLQIRPLLEVQPSPPPPATQVNRVHRRSIKHVCQLLQQKRFWFHAR